MLEIQPPAQQQFATSAPPPLADLNTTASLPDQHMSDHTRTPETRSGRRIAELEQVEQVRLSRSLSPRLQLLLLTFPLWRFRSLQSIAHLLHFAGCTLASLHPDPLSSFTSREVALDDDSAASSSSGSPPPRPQPPPASTLGDEQDREAQFIKYSEAYYTTLNVSRAFAMRAAIAFRNHLADFAPSQDIQLSLRTSIRHLRLSKASAAPILDPSFASLSNSSSDGSTSVGAGGVARGDDLKDGVLPLQTPSWGKEAKIGGTGVGERDGTTTTTRKESLGIGAMRLEKEAWEDLATALEKK